MRSPPSPRCAGTVVPSYRQSRQNIQPIRCTRRINLAHTLKYRNTETLDRRYRRRLDAADANNPDRAAKQKEHERRKLLGPDEKFLEDSGDVKEYRRRVAQKMMKAVEASDHKHLKQLYKTAGEVHTRYLPSDEALIHCARTETGDMTCAKILLPWCYFRTMLKALQIGLDRREADAVRLLLECKEATCRPIRWAG